MKVLLDENLPHRLRHEIVGHDVSTVAYEGWSGIDNGQLLARAAAAGYDVVISNDRGLEYEQHLGALPAAIVVLLAATNTIDALRPLLPELHSRLANISRGQFVKISPP